MRPPSFFQKCRDQQWYINQLEQLHTQQIADLKLLAAVRTAAGREVSRGEDASSTVPPSPSSIASEVPTQQSEQHGTSSPLSRSSNADDTETPTGPSPSSISAGPSLATPSGDRKREDRDIGMCN